MAKFKVGMIGCGMVSPTYMDAFSNLSEQVELVGVVASDMHSAHHFTQRYQQDQFRHLVAYETMEQMVAAQQLDFIILATPPHVRESFIEKSIAYNLPVLMEKPVERNLANASRLVEKCEQAEHPFAIMLQHRARPSAQALYDQLQEYDTGPLHLVEIAVPWWREQSYYDQPGRGSYARDGGGVMISQAIHTLDLALQFTSDAHVASAFRSRTAYHDMEAEDYVSANLRFSCGAIGHVMASTACYPGRSETIWLHFKHVSFKLESAQLEINTQPSHELGSRQFHIGERAATGAGADPMAFTSDWHRMMIENFMAHLQHGEKLIASARSALAVHQLIDAIENLSSLER